MARFTKDVLYPGTYRLPDGRRVSYSRADIKHLANRINHMVEAGLSVPVCWSHRDGAKPAERMSADELADRDRYTLGWVNGAKETEEGYLTVDLEVPGQADAQRLPAVRFVSPEICTDFRDGADRLWGGKSITHVAVTGRPVQHNQRPFQPARLSVDLVRLSLEGYEVAEEKAKDKPDEKESGELGESGGVSLKKVLTALAGRGITLPEGTSETNLLERLYVACTALGGDTGSAPTDTPADTVPPVEGSAPVMMSMDAVKALQNRLLAKERSDLERRVRDLAKSGRVNNKRRDTMLSELQAVRLSIDSAGNLAGGSLLAKIEAYEDLEPSPFSPSRLSLDAIEEGRAPGERPVTEEEAKKVVAEWDAAMGRKKTN